MSSKNLMDLYNGTVLIMAKKPTHITSTKLNNESRIKYNVFGWGLRISLATGRNPHFNHIEELEQYLILLMNDKYTLRTLLERHNQMLTGSINLYHHRVINIKTQNSPKFPQSAIFTFNMTDMLQLLGAT